MTSALVGATLALSGVAVAVPADPPAATDPALTVVTDPAQQDPAPPRPDPAPAVPVPSPADTAAGVPAPERGAATQPDEVDPAAEPAEPAAAPAADADSVASAAAPAPLAPGTQDAAADAPETAPEVAATTGVSADACTVMSTEIRQANNPTSRASLVSKFPGEIRKAGERWGFTEDKGVVFRASAEPGAGLEPVYRLWHPETGDFLWILTERGRDNAVERFGYQLMQTDFYVSPQPVDCGVPVYRYLKGGRHRLVVSLQDRRQLEASGWRSEGAKFWAAPADGVAGPDPVDPAPPVDDDGDSVFSIAVIPDTQYDVFGSSRFTNRAEWLVANREQLDLRFVLHTGDVVDYDTPDHWLYENASRSLQVLDDAGVPTALTIGNHDTAAVGVGGSAKSGGNAKLDVRDTRTFNAYFPASRYHPEGVFEEGKVDNNYQLFSAGGEHWMILTLELWPRLDVIDWARGVVASHPHHNVIVQTHSYMDEDGSIYQHREYGATSPQYLFESLISQYPNIKMVFSGHNGTAASREDLTTSGTKVAAFLGAFHTAASNPIRLVEIDTRAGTVSTRFFGPINGGIWPQWDAHVSGMAF